MARAQLTALSPAGLRGRAELQVRLGLWGGQVAERGAVPPFWWGLAESHSPEPLEVGALRGQAVPGLARGCPVAWTPCSPLMPG